MFSHIACLYTSSYVKTTCVRPIGTNTATRHYSKAMNLGNIFLEDRE
jgi:hypothetical protein